MLTQNEDLYVGTILGLFKTTDFGESWTATDNGLSDKFVKGLVIKDDKFFAITYSKGVYCSSDEGMSWVETNSGLTNLNTECIAVNNNDIYLGTIGGGIFLSQDNCQSWSNISSKLPAKEIACMAVYNNNLYVGTYKYGFYMTSDNGTNWQSLNNGLTNKWVSTVVFKDNNIFLGTITAANGAVFTSTDEGNSWEKMASDMTKKSITSMYLLENTLVFGTSTGDICYSRDNGINWTAIDDNLPSSEIITLNKCGNFLFASVQNAGLFKMNYLPINVQEKTKNNYIYLSPNPAGDFITLTFKPFGVFEPSKGSEIQIYNTLGEKVISVGNNDRCSLRINISELPKGVYFVKAGSQTAKFVKM